MNLKPRISDDIRDSVVRAIEGGEAAPDVANRFGVGLSTVYRWVRQARSATRPGLREMTLERELRAARERIEELTSALHGTYEPQVQRALLELFLEGKVQSRDIAAATGLPEDKVVEWRRIASTRPPARN